MGIYSAALKKQALSTDQYAAMIAATTQLNTAGADLAPDEWRSQVDVIESRGLVPFVDLAYQGYGDGIAEDAYAVRALADARGQLRSIERQAQESQFQARALAARRESVWVSDFEVGQRTTSNFFIISATSGGGSSPFEPATGISTSTTRLPRLTAACRQA